MRLTVTLITGFSLLLAIPVAGQDNPRPFGTVQSGNTTSALAYKPSLMNDPRYLKSHPDLDAF